ncbi:hypothetical protein TTHERM_00378530 (macronuclear) [Tetrahymena thermophila SB210]|uniref:Uncharacterized protein n=1 Tax=Tetrahymena thermophila (strain SB210) TaxID=312017 RepID=Q23FG4_TETTS|nr:hypothetical protein TTHERM_00378530 [Tetrahymena thermophila SB210]EAR95189.2 hypothetical protein TTHERM_00378530 [Tetrahymena thermophila SB210]|eukprot:XP_001015434.2 hypothetical protein TTHERM_00378530 [Tetrahymena thermophila SB210]
MLCTEDSLQHQLETEDNVQINMDSNLLKESDVHFYSEVNDLEKEALDRLQKIRQRIIHEDENEQTQNTIESSHVNLRNQQDLDQNRQNIYENQHSQADQYSNQHDANNKINSKNHLNSIESSNNLKEQYYFKLPPKGSKSSLNIGSTIADSQHVRNKSKDQTRSSVKFEENIEKNTFENNTRNQQGVAAVAVKNQKPGSSPFSNQESASISKKKYDITEQYKSSQDNLDNLNQQKEQMKYSQKVSKSSISNSPISQIVNKNNQVTAQQLQNETQKEKTQNKVERQIEDRLRRYEVSPKKQEQQGASQITFSSQNKIQRNSNNSFSACNKADDTDQSVDVSQIEKLQQKVIERKRSIDQINVKLSEKLNSPQSAIQQSKSQTPQSDTIQQKNRTPFDPQYDEYYQTNTSPSNFNAMQQFPPQTNPCPFLTGQQNIPVQAPNQFFSSVSSQHRLSAMVTQLSPNNQQNQFQHNVYGKENQINQSTNSAGSFSKAVNEKQGSMNKKNIQMQSEHSTIKDRDETLNYQEDTIHDLSKKLEAASQQSKRQQEEIQQLRQKIQNNNQISTQRKSKDQQNPKGSSSLRVSTTSSVRGLMQKNTKRTFNEKIIVEGESDLDDMSSSRDIIDDAISMTEENLDLKNEIIRLKEKIEDKEIENKKQYQMLLEQRNLIKKQEKEIEDLKTKCKEFEIGYSNVQKDVELIEKQYFIKKLKENNNLENEMYQQYNDELVKENSEILHKAAKLLEKYKELEYEYKKLLSEKEEEQHWKSVVQKRDQEILNLNRELSYIRSNQLKELSEYKDVIDRLGTNLETHDVKEIIKKFIEVCSQNKKHLEFQKQFYDIISSCQDPSVRKSEPLGAKESWDLFKKIFQDYLELRKKDRLDITLGNLLIKSLKIKSREEIIPEFTKKIMENEAYCNIIHKVKYHLNINHDCSIQELSQSIDQLLSKKLYYK